MVFIHQGKGADLGYGVNSVSDCREHFYDRDFCAPRSKELHHVQSYGTAADDADFLSGHILRILVYMLNHIKNRVHMASGFAQCVVKPGNGRKQRERACSIDKDVRLQVFDKFGGSFSLGKHKQVF